MATSALERRIDSVLHELMEVKKQLLMQNLRTGQRSRKSAIDWKKLGQSVSAAWDNVSAVDEIAAQREKG